MRCFIAIDLSDEVREELTRIQKEMHSEKAKLKFVEPQNLHLTLKFLGEISDYNLNQIKEALKQIKFKKIKARLNDIGVFPSPNYVRVIWIGLEPAEEIKELHNRIDEALSNTAKNDKRFESHVTLARVKFILDKKAFAKKLQEIKVKQLDFNIDSFKLKKSTLTKTGPIYEDIVVFKL